jgi:anti-anti-sigma regulatory factor
MTPTPVQDDNASDGHGCRIDQVDNCAVITPTGALDVDGYARVHDALTVAAAMSTRVVLVFTEVESLPPPAVGQLVDHLHRLRDDNARICLVGSPSGLRGSPDAGVLGQVFACRHSVDEALAALRGDGRPAKG